MATLLNGVNEVLKRTRSLDVSGELSSLTDEAKQVYIDLAIQLWNEVIDQLYSVAEIPRPNVLVESTITLATNDRDYALPLDLVQLYFPLLDETNGRYITEYPGGYMQVVRDQPFPANHTGLPIAGAIRPTDGELYLDALPTSNENGLVYKLRYDKDTELTAEADTMPFPDAVFRALVPVVAELWSFEHRNTVNRWTFVRGKWRNPVFDMGMGRACRLVRQKHANTRWGATGINMEHSTDPMET